MQTIVKKLLTTGLLLCLSLVTGCGKDANPMAPEAPPAPEYVDVTVQLVRLPAVADGDGIEGAGDFSYEAKVYDGTAMTVAGYEELETGSSHTLDRSRVIRIEKGQPYNIKVSFTATEWDRDIFGRTYADTRMDNLTESRTHSNGSSTAGFNDGERWITLGTGDLQLRLVYTITSKPVV